MHSRFSLFNTRVNLLILLIGVLFLSACGQEVGQNQLNEIKRRGELRVGTLYSSTTYRLLDSAPTGLDYELAKRFADSLGVRLKIVPAFQTQQLFDLLSHGKVDLIAAALMVTPKRLQWLRFTPSYYLVQQKLVYRNGRPRPGSLADIKDPIVVIKGSSHEDLLQRLSQQVDNLPWQVRAEGDSEALLREVSEGKIAYTIVDDTLLAQNQRFYPELAEAMTLSPPTPVGWALSRREDDTLYAALIDFFGQRQQDGTLAKLDEKYFGHVQTFDYVDTHTFLKRVKEILPKYRQWFESYAQGLDWRLLAAISYQESHWNEAARSYTGVRGLMMLTLDTAKDLGIADRKDPEQSIKGGAAYLRQLIDKVPDSVPKDEKIWFALVAYNMGYGHMLDARRLTKLRGGNPDAWRDLKNTLPLLHEAQWYSKTRYGYARGREARLYVNNIRRYYQSLRMYDATQRQQEERHHFSQSWVNIATHSQPNIPKTDAITPPEPTLPPPATDNAPPSSS